MLNNRVLKPTHPNPGRLDTEVARGEARAGQSERKRKRHGEVAAHLAKAAQHLESKVAS